MLRFLAVAAHNEKNPNPYSMEFSARDLESAERQIKIAFMHLFRDTEYTLFGVKPIPSDLAESELPAWVEDMVENYNPETGRQYDE